MSPTIEQAERAERGWNVTDYIRELGPELGMKAWEAAMRKYRAAHAVMFNYFQAVNDAAAREECDAHYEEAQS